MSEEHLEQCDGCWKEFEKEDLSVSDSGYTLCEQCFEMESACNE